MGLAFWGAACPTSLWVTNTDVHGWLSQVSTSAKRKSVWTHAGDSNEYHQANSGHNSPFLTRACPSYRKNVLLHLHVTSPLSSVGLGVDGSVKSPLYPFLQKMAYKLRNI